MQTQMIDTPSKAPNFLARILSQIEPAKGESRYQAVTRLRAARAADLDAKQSELRALAATTTDDDLIALMALGQAPESVERSDAKRQALAHDIHTLTAAVDGLTKAGNALQFQDVADRVTPLITKYQTDLLGFEKALLSAEKLYGPLAGLADQIERDLGSLIALQHMAGNDATTLLSAPMDTSRLAFVRQWREAFGDSAAVPSRLARWRADLAAWLGR